MAFQSEKEGKKVIKIRVSRFVIKWGDKQVVLVSKPKKGKNKKKNGPANGNSNEVSPHP
jgi:hypothetical protein